MSLCWVSFCWVSWWHFIKLPFSQVMVMLSAILTSVESFLMSPCITMMRDIVLSVTIFMVTLIIIVLIVTFLWLFWLSLCWSSHLDSYWVSILLLSQFCGYVECHFVALCWVLMPSISFGILYWLSFWWLSFLWLCWVSSCWLSHFCTYAECHNSYCNILLLY